MLYAIVLIHHRPKLQLIRVMSLFEFQVQGILYILQLNPKQSNHKHPGVVHTTAAGAESS
jgi:hypothetical protein